MDNEKLWGNLQTVDPGHHIEPSISEYVFNYNEKDTHVNIPSQLDR